MQDVDVPTSCPAKRRTHRIGRRVAHGRTMLHGGPPCSEPSGIPQWNRTGNPREPRKAADKASCCARCPSCWSRSGSSERWSFRSDRGVSVALRPRGIRNRGSSGRGRDVAGWDAMVGTVAWGPFRRMFLFFFFFLELFAHVSCICICIVGGLPGVIGCKGDVG